MQILGCKRPCSNDSFDRLYWTGEGGAFGNDAYPRVGTNASMIASSVFPAAFRLGVPAPTGSTNVSKQGTPDATQTPFDVLCLYFCH